MSEINDGCAINPREFIEMSRTPNPGAIARALSASQCIYFL